MSDSWGQRGYGQPGYGPPPPGPMPPVQPPPGSMQPGLGPAPFGPDPLGHDPRPRGGDPGADGARAAGPRAGRDGPAPRHLAPAQTWDLQVARGREMPTRRRGLNWLMLIPVVMPLLVPLYNRVEPRLFGLPFFYWYQLACVLLAIVTVTFVYVMTKGRRPRW